MSDAKHNRAPGKRAAGTPSRRASQRAQDQTLETLRSAFDAAREGILVCDAADRVVFSNRAYADGISIPVEPGMRFEDLIRMRLAAGDFPEARGNEEGWLRQRLAERKSPGQKGLEMRVADRWLHVTDQRTADGGTLTFVVDISERKAALQVAESARRQLGLALQFSRAAVWDFNLVDDALTISAGWDQLSTGPLGERRVTRDAMIKLIHPDDRDRTVTAFVNALKGITPLYSAEFRALTMGGRWLWILSRGQVSLRDPEGRAMRMIGVNIDITDRKKAEAELRTSERRFKSLVTLSNDNFWETDQQHRFVAQDFAETSQLQQPDQFVLGKTRWEIPHTSPDAAAWEQHRAQLEAREVFLDFELGRPLPDGMQQFISVSGEPVFDEGGAFTGYRGVAKDITARKQAEMDLRRLNAELEQRIAERTAALEFAYRELEAFSYSVSHDLRAPLRAISGYAGFLREDEGDRLSDGGRGYLAAIDDSARHMWRLIDALLSLAHTSRQALSSEMVDLGEIGRMVVRDLGRDYPDAVVTLADLPRLLGDPTLLRQVFSNLVGNALKYSANSRPQQVEIGISTLGAETVFFVRDNGVGFDMADSDKLFQAFGRLHTAAEFQGTGIGLVLTKLIVERHGGRIWAESRPGSGAQFSFTLGAPLPGPMPG